MVNYQEPRVKLTNTQLHKSKSAAKNKTGIILRITKKNFRDEELRCFISTTSDFFSSKRYKWKRS